MIKISYIIITWNGRQLFEQLLLSLRGEMQRSDVEVVVVDNGSTDGTGEFLRGEYLSARDVDGSSAKRVIYHRLEENKGVAYARNRAIELSHGTYLFILDNDIVANSEALRYLENYMDTHPDTGLCACRLLYPDGQVQQSYKVFPGIGQKILNVLHPGREDDTYAVQVKAGEPFEPDYVIGACQVLRRDVYDEVGPLDENIFYGPEDCDYCLRVRKAGRKVMYLPAVSMVHHCQRKTTSRPFSALGRKHIRALLYFYWKYKRI